MYMYVYIYEFCMNFTAWALALGSEDLTLHIVCVTLGKLLFFKHLSVLVFSSIKWKYYDQPGCEDYINSIYAGV